MLPAALSHRFSPGLTAEVCLDRAALSRWLARQQLAAAPELLRAEKRARVYGGTLDTALLELGLGDENALAQALAAATGLPGPEPGWLLHGHERMRHLIDERTARRLRAQPVAQQQGRLQMAITTDTDLGAVTAWADEQHGLDCRFHILSELRWEALAARVHGAAPPARFLRLLAKLGPGGDLARGVTWLPTAPAPHRRIPAPPAETGPNVIVPAPEPEIDVSEDLTETGFATPPQLIALSETEPTVPAGELPDLATLLAAALETREGDEDRPARLARLRPHLHQPAMAEHLARWRAQAAQGDLGARAAIATLVELRDGDCVPDLIALLDAPDPVIAAAAKAGLRTLTALDFGAARWRWILWWRTWGKKHRVEWLMEALSATDPERRLQAAQELESVTGHYVGYHFDLGRRERQAARRRWQRWWEQTGRGRFGRA